MLILTIRTDKPEAEIGIYQDDKKLSYEVWQAHRQLAETIHDKIAKNLQFVGKGWSDIEGIVCFKGPGSFTGLRIGASVANALAQGNNALIVGSNTEHWIEDGLSQIIDGKTEKKVIPEYGAEAHITKQRK